MMMMKVKNENILPARFDNPLCEVFNHSLGAPEKDHGDGDTSKVAVMS